MSFSKTVKLTVLFAVLTLASFAVADVPSVLNYQGKLTDPLGDAVTDGTYSITFSIWTEPAGGDLKWTETQPTVVVNDGVFSVLLGTMTPIDNMIFDGPYRFLELQVNGEAIVPRIQMTSVGYSQRTGTIDGAMGGYISDSLIIVPGNGGLLFGNSRKDVQAILSRIELGVSAAGATISMFEPVDSKAALYAGEGKKVVITQNGLIMFGISDQDTTLIVEPNGDIRSVGQITMGQNSSDGTNTTVLGFENTADGDSSTIGGGSANVAIGNISVIAGGHGNTVFSEGGTIGGGSLNEINGNYATISGGTNNSAGGDYAAIPGGNLNIADGAHSYSAGYRSQALHDGSFVWADETEADFSSTSLDQFLIRAAGGVGINTNSPAGLLDVTGADGDGSVNFPASAIAAPEILDEAGLAANRTATPFSLTQGATTMDPLLQVTITIPAPGYIVIRAGGTMAASGTSKQNQALTQISETGTGVVETAYTVYVGSGDHDTPSSEHYFNVANERIFAKDSGSYIFYFEGLAHPGNGASAQTLINNAFITATYLPTAYGTVTAVVTAGDATNYDKKEFSSGDGFGPLNLNSERQEYKVDLRELELRVLKTKLEAEIAEKQLLEAKLAEQR